MQDSAGKRELSNTGIGNRGPGIRQRAGRALSDLIIAELFLVQATIESASALGDGISGLREQLAASNDGDGRRQDWNTLLKQTRESVVEPYSTRLKYFRKLVEEENAA